MQSNYGITPASNRQMVSNSVLAGIGSPIPLGQDRSKILLPGAASYTQNRNVLPPSSHAQQQRASSDLAKNSIGNQLIYDPFHVNAQRYADLQKRNSDK